MRILIACEFSGVVREALGGMAAYGAAGRS